MASPEHALKANTDDASHTPHARACLRIYAEIDTLSYLDKGDSKLAAALGKAFFESRSSKDVEAFWKLLLIKQLLFELSVRGVATQIASQASLPRQLLTLDPQLIAAPAGVNISLGVLCKETDQLKHSVVLVLQKLAQHVEDRGLKKPQVTAQLLLELYNAVWSGSNGTDIESQIFTPTVCMTRCPTCITPWAWRRRKMADFVHLVIRRQGWPPL